MIQRSWSNVVTISCLVIAASVLALQQALSGAPDVRNLLPAFALSPKISYIPLILLIVAGFVWLAGRRKPKEALAAFAGAQDTIGAPKNPQYLNVEDFYRTYDNVFLREIESLVRAEAVKYVPRDRESYLIRLASTVLGVSVFEWAWWQIGASQLRALNALNTKALTLENLRLFYDEGAESRPDFYKQYFFEQWLAFLRNLGFITENGTTVLITLRAKEFLKYLTHWGYDVSTKTG